MSKESRRIKTNRDFINSVYLPFISNSLYNPHLATNPFGEGIASYEKNGVQYKINSLGYRSEEFVENVDLLIMGCSNTFGYGIPEEYMWSNMLKSEDIKTLNSIAMSGDSAQGQVIKFFQYVSKFGNPKNLVAVLPSYRAEFPLHEGKWDISEEEKPYTLTYDNKASIVLDGGQDSHFEEYASSPYDPNKILTKAMCSYYTHTFINILEVYCKMMGIRFRYSINEWDYRDSFKGEAEDSLSWHMKNHSENYFTWSYPFGLEHITDEEKSLSCHSDRNTDKYFYRADDFIDGKNMGHWGLHENIHVAEAAAKALFSS